MDAFTFTTIAHGPLAVCNPLGDGTLDAMLARLPLPPGARVLDVGCGKAELLLRLIERRGVRGTGVDVNPAFLRAARAAAARRLAGDALLLHECRAEEFLAGQSAEGQAFDAALCVGASHALGGTRTALAALARVVHPGGAVLLGEGFWKRAPDPEYLAALGATADQLTDHAGTLALGASLGLHPLADVVTSLADFDRYEETYARAVEVHVAAHPEDPDAPALAARIAAWRDTCRRWGRDTLGFGLYLFATA